MFYFVVFLTRFTILQKSQAGCVNTDVKEYSSLGLPVWGFVFGASSLEFSSWLGVRVKGLEF